MGKEGGAGPGERIADALKRGASDEARRRLETLRTASPADRKAALRSLRTLVEDRPAVVEPVRSALAAFLEDDDRAVRLTTAKLFVALAEARPGAVVHVVPPLAERLADEAEFYYVRARAAEALGYVARERPDAVDDPAILADLRIGLSFDEPEVKVKLAKALEGVALGNPDRLRHQVASLADHLDDESELVRYHLSTALVAIGCESPDRLAAAREELVARLDDGTAHVRGRAAEALGLLAREQPADEPLQTAVRTLARTEDASFAIDRTRFALEATGESGSEPEAKAETEATADPHGTVGTREGVRTTTAEAVDAITSPDADRACPHCGLALPEADPAPPMCPRCGGPI